jgi:hypothetical protein
MMLLEPLELRDYHLQGGINTSPLWSGKPLARKVCVKRRLAIGGSVPARAQDAATISR